MRSERNERDRGRRRASNVRGGGESESDKVASTRPRVSVSPTLPVLSSSSLHPLKRLGQKFLVDNRVVDRIVNALGPASDGTIIEIGPGKGALTERLIDHPGQVVAIEFDRNLAPLLIERFAARNNFKLVQGDALQTDFCAEILPAITARVVANLPYNISTAILQRLIDQRQCLTEMVLMLQREVVDRITAPAGSTERGYLTVLVEAYCESEKLFDVAPSAFKPVPKVWSSVVQVKLHSKIRVEVKDEDLLWRIVSAGFAQRRKTILNNLRHAQEPLQTKVKQHGGASIVLCVAGVDLQRRAETLELEEWARIARAME